MDLVMQFSDRIYVIDFGKLISSGTPEVVKATSASSTHTWGW